MESKNEICEKVKAWILEGRKEFVGEYYSHLAVCDECGKFLKKYKEANFGKVYNIWGKNENES
jgi:hypothetical protein